MWLDKHKNYYRRSDIINNLEPTHFCDPLSDVNLHYFVTARNKSSSHEETKAGNGENSVLVVMARLDSITLFDQTEIGFDSPTTGEQNILFDFNAYFTFTLNLIYFESPFIMYDVTVIKLCLL